MMMMMVVRVALLCFALLWLVDGGSVDDNIANINDAIHILIYNPQTTTTTTTTVC
jgi:hypothetical protein